MLFLYLVAFVALFLIHQLWYRRLKYPKGPMPLPFIGNLHSVWNLDRWEEKFLEWRDQYGPIYTIWIGLEPMVTVNEYKLAMDMFVKDGEKYADRGLSVQYDVATRGGNLGLFSTQGELWRQQKKFALKVLRDFGSGKNQMQDRILDEVKTVFEGLEGEVASGAKEYSVSHYTDIAIGSVMNVIVCGYRYTTNNKQAEFYEFNRYSNEFMELFSEPFNQMAMQSEIVQKIPIIQRPFLKTIECYKNSFRYIDRVIKEHKENNDYSCDLEPNDMIDAFLLEQNRLGDQAAANYFTDEQLRNSCFDMWLAGQVTTTSSLTWTLGYVINYPKVQKALHDELDAAIGENRLIKTSDRPALPFMNAMILEAMRHSNIASLNSPRRTNEEIRVGDIVIPAGTTIFPQICTIMADPNVFDSPKEFNPWRFIDEKGQFKPADEVVPFSMGKRVCMGEALARMELFLFTANLIHQYKFLPGKEAPTLKREYSGAFTTMPYTCRVEKRFAIPAEE